MSLPASDTVSFELLEKKLNEVSFRSLLSKHVFHCDGTDIGTFASNLLRKLMTDELANEYSLSGKASAANLCKPRFDKTCTYKFVFDRCVKKFNSIQEKEIRKVVSDWLSQAKHRKYKKEQRASRKLEQPIISTGGAEDINDMDI
ncbi:hypothetical protein RN001_001206 [Aquatica leii]|uniref:BEN domain-containing protein n=1 Tax=Aquatica leii TaxID=1421715 RepID=A0AAN7PB94_9COLE|nr:hypothetical protein RN001_001206 [Aquatica leii]